MWEFHDRLEEHINAESCRAEIDSFERHGQLVPALGRQLQGDPRFDVELIYGARRLFVARHLNAQLLVEIRQMSDLEAIVAIDMENRQRIDVSPYERGLSFAQWLRAGYFGSQDDIARALQISASQVSRLLRLARLPSVILSAFGSPTTICEAWGRDLLDCLDDPSRRQATINAARSLAQMEPRLQPREVHRQLMLAAHGRKSRRPARDEVVKDELQRPLFRIRRGSRSVAFMIQMDHVTPPLLEEMRQAVANVLSRANPPANEMPGADDVNEATVADTRHSCRVA
jgi:ParB family chromosome partitioning protein